MRLRVSKPIIKNMNRSGAAEYFVYKASAVKSPVNRKSFVLLCFIPFRKKTTEAVKRKRKVASLRPDFEKKRKNSVVTKRITA